MYVYFFSGCYLISTHETNLNNVINVVGSNIWRHFRATFFSETLFEHIKSIDLNLLNVDLKKKHPMLYYWRSTLVI
jgi:hypothetical protein